MKATRADIFNACIHFNRSIGAVSYTHLDVYKRQVGAVISMAIGAGGLTQALIFSSIGAISVSYTHLDVYKRQHNIKPFNQIMLKA